MSSIYAQATDQDFSLSGPAVWPNVTVQAPADRYMVSRPELAYLQARRRMEETRQREKRDPEPHYIGVRIVQRYSEGTPGKTKNKAHYVQRFSHEINRESDIEDVKAFLTRLREMLFRCMPPHTTRNCWAQLRFYDRQQPTVHLLQFQQRWL